MQVITKRPVITRDNLSPEQYHNLFGLGKKNKDNSGEENEVTKYGGAAVGLLGQAAPSLRGIFERKIVKGPKSVTTVQAAPQAPSATPKGMSKGLKTGLIVGGSVVGVVLIALVIYAVRKKATPTAA